VAIPGPWPEPGLRLETGPGPWFETGGWPDAG
jgi:hypothetical protein